MNPPRCTMSQYFETLAHRASWRIHFNEDPGEFLVCHKCDNRKCQNFSHLFLGTVQDNVTDMMQKGRNGQVSGERNGRYTKPEMTARGEDHGIAKLTDEDVLFIRENIANISASELARRFDVSLTNIHTILDNKGWKHLPSSQVLRENRMKAEYIGRKGEDCPTSVLNWEIVKEIRAIYKDYQLKEIAQKYGVTGVTVKQVILNKTWYDPEYVYVEYPRVFRARGIGNNPKLNKEQVANIRELAKTKSNKELREMFEVTKCTMTKILHNRSWHDPNYIPISGKKK